MPKTFKTLLRSSLKTLGLEEAYATVRLKYAQRRLRNPLLRFFTTGMADFILHEAWYLLASLRWRLGHAALPASLQPASDHLAKRGYVMVPRSEASDRALSALEKDYWPRFEQFQSGVGEGWRPQERVKFKGMMAYPSVQSNQVHFDAFSDADIALVQGMIEESGAKAIIESVLKCKVSVYSIRSWRYLPREKYTTGAHFDNLPPHALKILFFRGEVTADTGALQFRDRVGDQGIAIGVNQILICDVNRVWHWSDNPKPGQIRDVIEICFMPEAGKTSIYQSSGFEAEHPVNPFKNDWHKAASGVVPVKWWNGQTSNRFLSI